jgi:hypothetical protein
LTILGRFVGGAPYFAALIEAGGFRGFLWLLADTGASHTTLLDRDIARIGIPVSALEPAPLVGIGGSTRSFVLGRVRLTFHSDEGEEVLMQDVWAVQHDLERLPPEEVARIVRLPSLVGRDIMKAFSFRCDCRTGVVGLER